MQFYFSENLRLFGNMEEGNEASRRNGFRRTPRTRPYDVMFLQREHYVVLSLYKGHTLPTFGNSLENSKAVTSKHFRHCDCKVEKMQAGFSYFDKQTPLLAIRSLFDQYDTNRNGRLEQEEMKNFLERDMGLQPDQSNIYSLLVDKDGDQTISFEEFLAWMRSGERFESISNDHKFEIMCNAVEYFKKYDLNNNNTLDQEEFKNLMKSLGYEDAESEQAFHKLDQFRSGKLSFWEFAKWLNWVPISF